MNAPQRSDRVFLVFLCLLAVAWGVLGWRDLPGRSFAGFDTDGHHVVSRVYAGSPAEAAGLKAGDRLSHADGVELKQAGALARLPHKKAGDRLNLTIERNEEILELRIVYAPAPPRSLLRSRVSLLVGLCFVLFPLLAFLRQPGSNTRLLVLMGFGLSLSLMPEPAIGDFGMRSLTGIITSLLVLFGLAALLQFLLSFPHRRDWLGWPWTRRLLYFPAFFLWVVLAYRVLFNPPMSSTLSAITPFFTGAVIFAYLLGSLYLLLRNFSRSNRKERKTLGLNAMLIATVAAILPVFVAQLVRVFSPNTPLPGQDFYFISLVLLPMFWARAAERRPGG